MSVTAAGENAGQLHKAGCAAPPPASMWIRVSAVLIMEALIINELQ